MLTGAAIEVPLVASAVWVLAQFGVGNPEVPFVQLVRLTALFAGLAALLTAGGIGRLAAYAFVDGGRRRAMFVAARAHAVASIGLVVIAAIPHGMMPDKYDRMWLAYPIAGVFAGIVAGVVIGLVCSTAAPVGLADVWSLARQPTRVGARALRTLLSPEDLVRLGTALRTRTSQMFEGIFEPAPRPPEAPKKPESGEPPTAAPAPPPADGKRAETKPPP